jgi:hypothetical chaperone protein
MNYLAIDFGTTNSIAAILTDDRQFIPITFENGNPIFPSSAFIQMKESSAFPITKDRIEARFFQEKQREEVKKRSQLDEVKRRLDEFSRAKTPKVKKPKPVDFIAAGSQAFLRAMRTYEKDLDDLDRRIRDFNERVVPQERVRLESEIISVRTDTEILRQVEMLMSKEELERRSAELREFYFFNAIESDDFHVLLGHKAIDAYVADPLSGFFLRSPKAFLASTLAREYQFAFVKIIGFILRTLKERAESLRGTQFSGVVLGRPVEYLGANDDAGNRRALNIMTDAARLAGFTEVRFVFEPLAAALVSPGDWNRSGATAVVIDIGGGTSDIAALNALGNDRNSLEVLSVKGRRVGGNDLDQAFAFQEIGPSIGKQSLLKGGMTSPSELINWALSTRDIIAQNKFRNAGDQIADLQKKCVDPVPIGRLLQTYRDQLQHRILLSSEEAKIKLSDSEIRNLHYDLDLSYFEEKVELRVTQDSLKSSWESELGKLKGIVQDCLVQGGVTDRPVWAYFTGGLSLSPLVRESLTSVLPANSLVKRLNAFQAVVAGLSYVARDLSRSGSPSDEPREVRGISVMRA